MKKAFITNLGCKVNQYEAQALRKIFAEAGYESVHEADGADVCIVNTCSVTSMADRKSRQFIRQCRTKSPEAIIAVTGCYAQTGTAPLSKMPEVDIIAGTNEKGTILRLVKEAEKNRLEGIKPGEGPTVAVRAYEDLTGYEEVGPVLAMEGRTRAYIKIQEGCNRFCSYCIIPYARGNVRSRDEGAIVEEARLLIEEGYREIVLTGINTALYGAEEDGEPKLDRLLESLSALEGEFRIRLSSVEPTVINADFIKKLFRFDKLCHHAHLSLQSGSDAVLKAMNRLYTRKDYLEIVEVIKEFDPNYGITTDIIVGFPGEEEADFKESESICREIDFCRVHPFRYSKRSGTPAASAENQVSGEVKQERARRLSKEAGLSAERFIRKNLGTVRTVLFEEYVEKGGYITGLTDNYIRVYVKWKKDEPMPFNSFKSVELKERLLDGVLGILL